MVNRPASPLVFIYMRTYISVILSAVLVSCGGSEFRTAFQQEQNDGGPAEVTNHDGGTGHDGAKATGGSGGAAGRATGGSGTGGATGTGGTKSTGGATATGGATGTGGAKETGGVTGTGGTTSTGGGSGSGGAPDAGPTCLTDLSGVGTGDFQIAFAVTTTHVPAASTYMALLNQRARCDNTLPGWDVWMTADGSLGIEVFDGKAGVYDNVTTDGRAINDGVRHRIVVRRSGTLITVNVDGVVRTYPSELMMALDALSPMNVGIDPLCPGVKPFSGQLTDVCLTR